jgi:hypothetical protein
MKVSRKINISLHVTMCSLVDCYQCANSSSGYFSAMKLEAVCSFETSLTWLHGVACRATVIFVVSTVETSVFQIPISLTSQCVKFRHLKAHIWEYHVPAKQSHLLWAAEVAFYLLLCHFPPSSNNGIRNFAGLILKTRINRRLETGLSFQTIGFNSRCICVICSGRSATVAGFSPRFFGFPC